MPKQYIGTTKNKSSLNRTKIALNQIEARGHGDAKQVNDKIISNKFGLYLEMCYICSVNNKNKQK